MMEPGFYNLDCMEAMKGFPDGFFDLAIVDPPYGIKVASHHCGKVVGGGTEDSVVNPVYRAAKSRVATRNFTTPSRMTAHPTKVISESWRG
jgi:DNA modification methylase